MAFRSCPILLPKFFGFRAAEDLPYAHAFFDQQFANGITGNDLNPNFFRILPFLKPKHLLDFLESKQSSGQYDIKNLEDKDKDKFQIMLNVKNFLPTDLEVKVVDDYIVIHGKNDEEIADEHGLVQREFTRRYVLPKGIEADSIKSSLSKNGVLTIEAPMKSTPNERIIPITVPHLKL